MKELCVVHLVRALNGIEPFERFLESYRQHPGGTDHDFLIVFKGFDSPNEKAEHLKLLAPFRYFTLDVDDAGFDITAYFAAVRKHAGEYRYFCFLNSFSVILDSGWASKLYQQISLHGVGLVGATGSWQSHRGSGMLWLLMTMVDVAIRDFLLHRDKPVMSRLAPSTKAGWQRGLYIRNYIQFPNYHLRTNTFMISSELMDKIIFHEIKSKADAYEFESGQNGLTQQVLAMGKAVLVVGKDGVGCEKERWNESRTFWQTEQENLLVSDNQTRDYQYGSKQRRKSLSNGAWTKLTGWHVLKLKVRYFVVLCWMKFTGIDK
jgi:hypothetical protein